VFGESAGAMSILTLMSITSDLFHKAILQSGSAHIAQEPDHAALVVKAVAAELNVDPTAEEFKNVAFKDLIAAQDKVHRDVLNTADRQKYGDSTIDSCGLSFMPVVDRELVHRPPIQGIRVSAGSDIPMLIGTTIEEYRFFVMPYDIALLTDVKQWQKRLAAYHVPDSMYDQYASRSTAPYSRSLPSEVFAAVMSERLLRISTYRVAEAREHALASIHVFELGWRSPVVHASQPTTDNIRLGACPVTDIPFVWDSLDAAGVEELIQDPPKNLAYVMRRCWIEFAKTGELADWQPYDTEARAVMAFYQGQPGHEPDRPGPQEQRTATMGQRRHFEVLN
jgi:para-nitrobenzyl esterase